MRKVSKSIWSVAGILTVAIATVLPAPKIASPQTLTIGFGFSPAPAKAQSFTTQRQASTQQLTAAASISSDLNVLQLPEASLGVREIPVVAPPPPPPSAPVSAPITAQISEPAAAPNPGAVQSLYTLGDLNFQGVIFWEGLKFTYYSQSVLPGGGLNIPGRHVNAGGFVSDGDGFVVLAGSAPLGTVYNTPFGWPGKIYDRGTVGNHLDIYTM